MGKADDSRRTKKYPQQQGKKLGESKKTAKLKKKDSLSKNKANTVYCEFYYDFGWFFMDFREKQAKRGQFYCVKSG